MASNNPRYLYRPHGRTWCFRKRLKPRSAGVLGHSNLSAPYVISLGTTDRRTAEMRRDILLRQIDEIENPAASDSYREAVQRLERLQNTDPEAFNQEAWDAWYEVQSAPDWGEKPDPDAVMTHRIARALQDGKRPEQLLPLSALVAEYHAYREREGKKWKPAEIALEKLVSFHGLGKLASVRMDQLTEAHVARWLDSLSGLTRSTTRGYLSHLNLLWKFAKRRGLVTGVNPFAEQETPGKVAESRAEVPDEVFRRIWPKLDEQYQRYCLILRQHGYRPKELLAIERVTFEGIECWQGGLKTEAGQSRVVPIHKDLLQTDLNIGKDARYLTDKWRLAKAEAGIDHPCTPGGFRPTFNTLAINAGADPWEVGFIIGHARGESLTDSRTYYRGPKMQRLKQIVDSVPLFDPSSRD